MISENPRVKEGVMANYRIKCEAIRIMDGKDCCPGSAKCKLGETYIIGPRTPEPVGMCGRAFHSIHPMAFAMRFSEQMFWEKDKNIEVTCPDGLVVYRLSRIRKD